MIFLKLVIGGYWVRSTRPAPHAGWIETVHFSPSSVRKRPFTIPHGSSGSRLTSTAVFEIPSSSAHAAIYSGHANGVAADATIEIVDNKGRLRFRMLFTRGKISSVARAAEGRRTRVALDYGSTRVEHFGPGPPVMDVNIPL